MSNSLWVLAELIIFIIFLVPLLTHIKYKRNIGWKIVPLRIKQHYSIYIIFLLLFCIFDKSGGDFFHYKELVADLYSSPGLPTGLEDIYVWLISKIGYSYYLFRLIVWGSALFVLTRILNHLQINNILSIWSFMLFALVDFSYARVSLGLVLCFYGFILLYENKNNLSLLYGLILITASLFFHKTIIILTLLCLVSIFIKISKRTALVAVILFPVLVYLMNYYVPDLFYYIEAGSSEARYLSAENEGKGLAAKLLDYLKFIPIIILLSLTLKQINKVPNSIPKYIERLITLIIVILYTSSILSFLEFGSAAISYRIRNMIFIPVAIIEAYYLNNKPLSVLQIIVIGIITLSNIFYFLYMYYLKTIGLGI